MSRMKISDGGKHFSIRAVVSTLVGETGDSLIFFPIAFWGLVSVPEMLKLMAVQIVAKTLYEIYRPAHHHSHRKKGETSRTNGRV